MAAYLALHGAGVGGPPGAAARQAVTGDPAWRIAVDEAPWLVFVRGPAWPRVRRLPAGRGFVVGDLFRQRSGTVIGEEIESVVFARRLSVAATAEEFRRSYWGRFVALISAGERDSAGGVYRDPSGAADALAWRAAGLELVGSHLPAWLPASLWPDLAFDWSAIGLWLQTGAAVAWRSGFREVAAVFPGASRGFDGAEIQHWRPAEICRSQGDPGLAVTEWPDLLDRCVAALAGEAQAIRAEISGGLDSAILASSLAACAGARVRAWENVHPAGGPGDERGYARDVAGLWKVALTEIPAADFAIDPDRLAETATGLRPGFSAFDPESDAAAADRCARLGVDRVFTGQGGDMVFFQMPAPALAADLVGRRGLRSLVSGEFAELARWTRRSVFALAGEALRPGRVRPGELRLNGHPWMEGLAELPPGRRLQIASLAQKLTIHIENRQSQVAEVIHPLLAQPIVEACLSLSAADLVRGGRDRALAREAFAARLPASIGERRGKGELSGYYGRALGRSLERLRPYLLDGRLVGEGLLDRRRLEAMLTPDSLIWTGAVHPLLTALAVEAWIRNWTGRKPPAG